MRISKFGYATRLLGMWFIWKLRAAESAGNVEGDVFSLTIPLTFLGRFPYPIHRESKDDHARSGDASGDGDRWDVPGRTICDRSLSPTGTGHPVNSPQCGLRLGLGV
jgi:hypothetical protein